MISERQRMEVFCPPSLAFVLVFVKEQRGQARGRNCGKLENVLLSTGDRRGTEGWGTLERQEWFEDSKNKFRAERLKDFNLEIGEFQRFGICKAREFESSDTWKRESLKVPVSERSRIREFQYVKAWKFAKKKRNRELRYSKTREFRSSEDVQKLESLVFQTAENSGSPVSESSKPKRFQKLDRQSKD